MNIYIYLMIAIIGCLFGSFFTLAVYRLPLKEDITHKRSYCPKCGHRLNFFDLIPVLSYIFLSGKCRYCKEPIHPRYILFELFTSLIFILLALSMKISAYSSINLFILFIFNILIITVFMINGLIVKEGNKVNLGVTIFGYIVCSIYLFICKNEIFITSIFSVLIYLIILNALLFALKRKLYIVDTLYLGIIVYYFGINISIILMFITLVINIILKYILKKKSLFIYYISMLSILFVILINIDILKNIFEFRWFL